MGVRPERVPGRGWTLAWFRGRASRPSGSWPPRWSLPGRLVTISSWSCAGPWRSSRRSPGIGRRSRPVRVCSLPGRLRWATPGFGVSWAAGARSPGDVPGRIFRLAGLARGTGREGHGPGGAPVGLEYSIVVLACLFWWLRQPVRQRSGTRALGSRGPVSADPVLGEVDLRRAAVCLSRCQLVKRAMRSRGVVVPQVLGRNRGRHPPHKCPNKRTLIGTTGRRLAPDGLIKPERADDQRERVRGRLLTLPGTPRPTVMTACGPAEERSQLPCPKSVFPQVKWVRVVRGGVEPPTFRFSGVLSPPRP
jgi:hypothetical protein